MYIDTKFVTFCAACALAIAGPVLVTGPASAAPEPEVPEGCTVDSAVPNQITLTCQPGSGVGQHAFIRCRDIGGLDHSRIGLTIGTSGGSSRAVCAPGESGPVRP